MGSMHDGTTSTSSVSARLRAHYEQLSAAHKRVAGFMLEEPRRAAFLSAARIASELGLSTATVVRLAPAVGISGFPDLQQALQHELLDERDTIRRLQRAADELPTTPSGVLENVLRGDAAYLQATLREISPIAFEAAVEHLVRARRVYAAGLFQSIGCVQVLVRGLRLIGIDARTANGEDSDVGDDLLGVGPEDVIVAYSQVRYPRRVVEALDQARRGGARAIAIVDNPLSPLGRRADVTLVVANGRPRFYQTLIPAVSVTGALVTAMALARSDASRGSLQAAEDAWKQTGAFHFEP
jgi:DNA-binding MurR/RpiR family transcriptional regulator